MEVKRNGIDPEILQQIDMFLENFYQQSVAAGNEMARVELSPSQVRSLETLITSTTRFSEVINYIKNQIGKDRQNKWSQVGSFLLGQLDQIEAKVESMKNLFRITGRSLTDLEIEGISETIISKIKNMALLPFADEKRFRDILEKLIGYELKALNKNDEEKKYDESEKTRQTILKYARIETATILTIKMILVRKWCKQVVAHYCYKRALMGKNEGNQA
ncbi:hypothetical protein [Desulfobacterium sp. N47]|uniref:Uncharacterized protein n=1 Tax=uncultured Desulfobacterium sp. TaxID=201089 RepID=E1YMB1_9BACT|nr:unknown protein [uncultured Desulfobacterium sp.]